MSKSPTPDLDALAREIEGEIHAKHGTAVGTVGTATVTSPQHGTTVSGFGGPDLGTIIGKAGSLLGLIRQILNAAHDRGYIAAPKP
jgi:hypothetical protein